MSLYRVTLILNDGTNGHSTTVYARSGAGAIQQAELKRGYAFPCVIAVRLGRAERLAAYFGAP